MPSACLTGFATTDVSVTNGTLTAVSFPASGTTYTFTITPTASGAVTVNIDANVAQDAATNGNTAASQFSIAYAPPAPNITSLAPGLAAGIYMVRAGAMALRLTVEQLSPSLLRQLSEHSLKAPSRWLRAR